MNTPTFDDFNASLKELTEGIPGRNEPHDTGSGQLDNGEVRLLLAGAAWTAVCYNPTNAFDCLSKFFDREQLKNWFGTKRAELILNMLLYQTNWSDYSTWLSRYARDLFSQDSLPDARWRALCAQIDWPSSELKSLGRELERRLSMERDELLFEKRRMTEMLASWRKDK